MQRIRSTALLPGAKPSPTVQTKVFVPLTSRQLAGSTEPASHASMVTVAGSTPTGRQCVTWTPSAVAGPMFETVSVNVAHRELVRCAGPSTAIFRSAPDVMPRSRRKTAELPVLS